MSNRLPKRPAKSAKECETSCVLVRHQCVKLKKKKVKWISYGQNTAIIVFYSGLHLRTHSHGQVLNIWCFYSYFLQFPKYVNQESTVSHQIRVDSYFSYSKKQIKLYQFLYLLNLMHQKVAMAVDTQEVSGVTLWQWQMVCMSNRSGRRAFPLNFA